MNTTLTYTATGKRSLVQDMGVVLGSSLLLGLLAQIAIPLPFTPIPLVIYSQCLLVLSVLLGSQRALAVVCLFLIEGSLGLPVFFGGRCGLAHLLGPTGGYLIGFALAAFITGWLSERLQEKTKAQLFGCMAVGNGILLLTGTAWLASFLGWKAAFMCGFIPFVVTDSLKLCVATCCLGSPRHERVL